jgi:hypothetical protein
MPEVNAQEIARLLAIDWLRERAWLFEHAPRPQLPRQRRAPASSDADDVLLTIPAPVYVEALTGVYVPAGGVLSCPFDDHDDSTPSFTAYGDPRRGFYCFGCHRGGTIYDFGARLWGMRTRGAGFIELRQRLAEALLGAVA